MNEIKIYSREECWSRGGLKTLLKETTLFDCIGETICPHIIECYRGIRKAAVDGGDEMTDDEIRALAENYLKFHI